MKDYWGIIFRRALAVVLLSAGAAGADAGVRDDGGVFGREAARSAAGVIQEVERRFGAEVLVETMDRAPAQMAGKLECQGAERFFEKWAKCRAKRAGAVYVLVVRQPEVVKVKLGKSAEGWGLGREEAAELEEMIAGAVRKGDYDEGLGNGVAYVQRTVARKWGGAAAADETRQAAAGGWWAGLSIGAAMSAMGAWGLARGRK